MNLFWIWQIQKLEQVHPVSVPTLPASETINQTFKNMIYWKKHWKLHAALETKVYTSDPKNDIFEKVYTSDNRNCIFEKVYTSDSQNDIFEKVYTSDPKMIFSKKFTLLTQNVIFSKKFTLLNIVDILLCLLQNSLF